MLKTILNLIKIILNISKIFNKKIKKIFIINNYKTLKNLIYLMFNYIFQF